MIKLLAIEWLKIKRYPTFWILAALFALLLPLWVYGVASGFISPGGGGKNGPKINFFATGYTFPQVWASIGYWASVFIMFVSMIVIILTTNEYGYRTNRQNVLDGWTKMQFFHSKVLLVVVLSLLTTLYVFALGTVFGRIYTGSFSGMFHELRLLGYFFLLSLDYLGFGLFLAILIRKSGLAIGLFLLYSMFLETILKSIVNHYTDKPYANLLMLQSSDELLPFPLPQMAKAMIGIRPTLSVNTYLIATIGWCVVYYVACRLLLLRKDW